MIFDEVLETLLRRVTEAYGQESEAARKEWFLLAGEPFLDEPGYEQRMQNFVEWYVFEHCLAGGDTPFETFLADTTQPAEQRESFLPFRAQVHSLFQIKRRLGGGVHARDLRDGRKYVLPKASTVGYEIGGIVEMRVVSWEDGFHTTQTNLYYAASMAPILRKAARTVRKKGRPEAWTSLLFRASALHLKAARFRHVKTKEIFKDLLQPEWLAEAKA